MYHRILVPLDGSGFATRALDAAIFMAQSCQAEIHLLHVIRRWALPQEIINMISAGEIQQSRQEIMEDSAELILGDGKERLAQAGLTPAAASYVFGDPAQQIVSYATEHDIDLLVIGHRGLGARLNLLGSVVRAVLNSSDASCLVIS